MKHSEILCYSIAPTLRSEVASSNVGRGLPSSPVSLFSPPQTHLHGFPYYVLIVEYGVFIGRSYVLAKLLAASTGRFSQYIRATINMICCASAHPYLHACGDLYQYLVQVLACTPFMDEARRVLNARRYLSSRRYVASGYRYCIPLLLPVYINASTASTRAMIFGLGHL